jgi:hypothetical protein
MNNYGFTDNVVYVPDFTYAIATMSGGENGEYALYILNKDTQDTNKVPVDPTFTTTFYHDGTVTTIATPFPDHPYPDDGKYFMKLYFGNECKWIQPDDSAQLRLIHWGWNED